MLADSPPIETCDLFSSELAAGSDELARTDSGIPEEPPPCALIKSAKSRAASSTTAAAKGVKGSASAESSAQRYAFSAPGG